VFLVGPISVSTGGQDSRRSEEYSTLVPVRGYANGTVAMS
jgi:hypothetical protein